MHDSKWRVKEEDYDKISQGDHLVIEHVVDAIKTDGKLMLKNVTTGEEIPCLCELSGRAKEIVLAGGLLNATKQSK